MEVGKSIRPADTDVRLVPEAEVNPEILNVSFGVVAYQSQAEAAYIGWGAERGLTLTPANTLSQYFFQIFREDTR